MARMARYKVENEDSWYHVYNRVAGYPGVYALKKPGCREHLIQLIEFYSRAYFCKVAAFCVMGNHYHLVIQFEQYRPLKPKELRERAENLYPNQTKKLDAWPPAKWQRLNTRLFDLSEFMRNVESLYARWFNQTHNRFGRFWADRYKSTHLADARALQDGMMYVDLNPVRAHLVKRPEEYRGASIHFREAGKAGWLWPLSELYGGLSPCKAAQEYRCVLYHRGAVASRAGQCELSPRILAEEEKRGFTKPGMFLKRLRYFTDGLALGAEALLARRLEALQEAGYFTRRRKPVPQQGGLHFTLRAQRGNAVRP